MSQENVERVRRAYEVINRAGLASEEAYRTGAELLHPDVEWRDQRELPGATVHHGVEGAMRHLAAAQESLDYERIEVLEILDAGPCVVAVSRVHAVGRASRVPVERDAVNVFSFRGAQVERVEIFATRSEALEAVGLRE
jgi:ketosteroid isomerase-like protein